MYFLNISPGIIPIVSLLISSVSLSASLIVAYFSNFKKSRPGVLIGSNISIYPAPYRGAESVIWGGTGIYIPMTFFNWSPNGGSIIQCRIMLARIDNPNEIYDMAWTEFAEMLQSERKMGNGGLAQPIPISPKSSLTKTVLFIWNPFSNKKLPIKEGRYSFDILLWTHSSSKPNIKQTFEFSVSKQQENDYQISLDNKTMLTIDISIRETNRDNNILTKEQSVSLYGN